MRSFLLQRRPSVLLLAAALTAGTIPGSLAAQQPTLSQARTLTLAQALEIAERNSETVGIAREELARAEGDRKRAKSGYFPQVNGSAYYLRTLESQFSALETGSDTVRRYPEIAVRTKPVAPGRAAAGLAGERRRLRQRCRPVRGFREPSVRPGQHLPLRPLVFADAVQRRAGERPEPAASANARSAALGLTSAQAQLLLDVTGAYYDATLADRLLGIAEATLEQADTR